MKRPKLSLINDQFKYLKRLRNLSIPKLRKLHARIFDESRFRLRLPRESPRDFIEKRLWVYYCARNYHYPKGHPAKTAFVKQAKEILSDTRVSSIPAEEQLRIQRREHERFSWNAIKAKTLVEIERALAIAGIYVECGDAKKRQLLYELYHKPAEDIPDEVIRNNRGTRLNNRYVLRDLIIENPQLAYDDFMEAYGEKMPTVSRASFNSTRSQLRRVGYKIPYGKPGPRNPAVSNGKATR